LIAQSRIRKAAIVALILVSVCIVLASVIIGAETISPAQAWREWRAHVPMSEAPTLSVFLQQRVPRTLAALLAGSGLALAGAAFQAMLRNPLATPYTLGVSSAGAFGAFTATVLATTYGWSHSYLGFSGVEVFSFLFAAIDVLLIYVLAVQKARVSPAVLLLAGVTLGMIANAGIMMMQQLMNPEWLVIMTRWTMGHLSIIGYDPVLALTIGVLPCMAVLLAQAGKFDQLGFGEELAAGRGVNVRRLQVVTFLVGSLMTAIIVSKVGPIGFVGLIVPHAVRTVTGTRHRSLLPLSMIVGGAFLCLCDIVARRLLPGETPVGIITALVGGPFFLYLLLRRRLTEWM
jgi:iron complex transport system permease protein